MALSTTEKLNVFLYFAPEDQPLYKELNKHLALFKREHGFYTCSNEQIEAGKDQGGTLDLLLKSADLVLFLISADFTAKGDYYNRMQAILKLQHERRTNVVFVHLRPCKMPKNPYTGPQDHTDTLPRSNTSPHDVKPVTVWGNTDAAYWEVCKGIERKITNLRKTWDPKRKVAQEDYKLYERRELEGEIADSNQTLLTDPENAEAYLNKGTALEALGRYKEASRMLDEAIKLNPNSATAYLNKGRVLYACRKFKKAVPVLDKAIRLNAYNPIAFLFKGMALYRLRRHKEAISVLKEAISRDEFIYYTSAFKDQGLRRLGHFEEDIVALKEVLRLNPYNLAAIYTGRGSIFAGYVVPVSRYAAVALLALAILLFLYLLYSSIGGAKYRTTAFVCGKNALPPWICTYIAFVSPKNPTHSPPSLLIQTPAQTPVSSPSASSQARYFMQQYYDHINKHEYGTAYFLWQDNITGHGQPYATFVADYQNTLHDDITITKIAPNTNNTAFDRPVTTPFDMSVTIYALERGNKKSTYHADYTVGIVDGSWRIIKGHIDN